MDKTKLYLFVIIATIFSSNVYSEQDGRAPAIRDPDLPPIDYPTDTPDEHVEYITDDSHHDLRVITKEIKPIDHQKSNIEKSYINTESVKQLYEHE